MYLMSLLLGTMLLAVPIIPSIAAGSQPASSLAEGVASTSSSLSCLHEAVASLAGLHIDEQKALNLAHSSPVFVSYAVNHTPRYYGYNIGYSITSTCGTNDYTLALHFALAGKELVAAEDVNSASILGVSIAGRLANYTNYPTVSLWSGWEFSAASPSSTPVYESYTSFSQPSVGDPSYNYCSLAFYGECDFGVWAGLEHDYAGSYIAQTGTGALVSYLSGSPVSTYTMWTEFFGDQSSQTCYKNGNPYNESPGDTMRADVLNEAETGGSNTSYYLTVTDASVTPNYACTSGPSTFTHMGVSRYAAYIAEDPAYYALPEINPGGGSQSFSMYGELYYGGVFYTIQTPYNAGYYSANSPYSISLNSHTEISSSNPSSGSFTQTWSISA